MIQNFRSSALIDAIGWTLLNSIWQIVLVVIILWIILNFITAKSARLSYIFSVSALLLICLMTSFTFISNLDLTINTTESTILEVPQAIESNGNDSQSSSLSSIFFENNSIGIIGKSSKQLASIIPLIVLGWMMGVLFFGIKFSISWNYLYFLKKTKISPPSLKWQKQVDQSCQKMGINKK
jgi:bla regulator protein BlaR1